jgi:uncharacterized membrane protein YfbV (UPF0208 family)
VPPLEHALALLTEMDVRFLALLAEMDLRYQQRFDAQGAALTAALLAAKEAVQTALTAAEKAVTKAETANEKRFEAVNEFRATLSDQASTFPSRIELTALAQRVTDMGTRLERVEARAQQIAETRTETRGGNQTLVAVVSAVLFAASIVVAVVALATRG